MSKKVKVPSNTPSPEMTERKRVEEALKESEAKFKTIVENIRDVVFQLSPLGIIQYVSPKVQEVYGYKPEDLVGKHFKKTTPVSELVKALDALKSVLSGKVIRNLEVNQLDSKGKIIPMEINIAPVRREGKIIAVQGIMRDITERKRAEEALVKSHDELEIRVQQRTAELAKANEELRNEITERKRTEYNLGERVKELNCLYGIAEIAERQDITLDELYQETVNLIPPSWQYPEITCARIAINGKEFKTENYRDAEWKQSSDIKVYGAKAGEVEVIYLEERPELDERPFLKEERSLIDAVAKQLGRLTERMRAEEELQKTIAELERSNAELERFAYIASHDLQEPLRMVASYTQLLEKRYKDRLDADAHDFIGYAVDGAKRMQQLINDLLTYSRVGTRGKPFEPTDCMTVFEAAVANLDVTIRESGAEVTSDPLPTVMADEGQLVQLFQNLIDNAVKFHGEEPRVHVSVEQKGDEWVFSVRDNGIGIDSQYLEHAFRVFQRLHSGKYRGTGIGLSIGKRIVERHGGRIWLESQPGKGTIVHFTIPVKGGKQS